MSAPAVATVTVRFARPSRPEPVAVSGRIPRVARLLALAHRIDAMIQAGELHDLAHAARACGVTRPRVTQIMNLLLLAPEIQEAILDLPPVTKGREPISERSLRVVVAEFEWREQISLWKLLVPAVDRTDPGAVRSLNEQRS